MPYDPYYSRGGYYYPPPIPLAREKETVNIFNENGRGRDYDQGYIDAMHRLNMSGSRSRSRSRHRSHSHSRHRSRSRSSVDREIDRLRKDLHHMEEKDVLEAREKELKLRWEVEIASKKDKEKSELEKMRAKVKFEEIMEKEKAEREYKEFEILQAKKKVEKELKEKKEKEAADAAARTTMRAIGWSDTQIDRAIAVRDREKVKETTIVTTTPVLYGGGHHHHHHGQMVLGGPRAPVYPRAHVKDIHIEVLKKYKIDWRYDTDPNYIVIFREMDQAYFEVLYEESRKRFKKGRKSEVLLVEGKKKHNGSLSGLQMVRKRSRSRSRSRHEAPEVITYIR